ncbi:MAG: cyclic nucleotide-binding domain-containing protein [Planctomycetota bacterium]|nr:cyclic nucleotide-binding domain-containing protein [Planctomycetota bacterium]
MSLRIGLARTPLELDAVFRIRHEVFVEEEGLLSPTPSGRFVDRFDAFPGVANVFATVEGQVVGSMRFMEYSEAGASPDDYYDFSAFIKEAERPGAHSQLIIRKDYRGLPGLTFSMIAMGYMWCIQRGLTHLTGAANPAVVPLFAKAGWELLGEEFHDEKLGAPVQPITLDLSNLNLPLQDFISKQQIDHVFSDFTRAHYAAGESLCRIGDPAEEVFVMVDGEVMVTDHADKELARVKSGELVGEVALLTEAARTANLTAVTDCWLMVLTRDEFNKQLRERPEVAQALLRHLAQRAVADSKRSKD